MPDNAINTSSTISITSTEDTVSEDQLHNLVDYSLAMTGTTQILASNTATVSTTTSTSFTGNREFSLVAAVSIASDNSSEDRGIETAAIVSIQGISRTWFNLYATIQVTLSEASTLSVFHQLVDYVLTLPGIATIEPRNISQISLDVHDYIVANINTEDTATVETETSIGDRTIELFRTNFITTKIRRFLMGWRKRLRGLSQIVRKWLGRD